MCGEDEGSPDNPIYLMEQFEVGSTFQHESFLRVENEDGSEEKVE